MFFCSRQQAFLLPGVLAGALMLSACSAPKKIDAQTKQQILIVSVQEQKMLFLEDGVEVERYLISTAKNGLGDTPDSYKTPAGFMEVAEKFGADLPLGSVLKDRQPTGEIIAVDAPGRDPIVSRVLWLRGLEEGNRNAYERFIYIHGTPQESLLGAPASFGCIRMRSSDIMALYERIYPGAKVWVNEELLDTAKLRWLAEKK
jgi:lipoprotein-anchoring transpeptidase ErfK/SrfK